MNDNSLKAVQCVCSAVVTLGIVWSIFGCPFIRSRVIKKTTYTQPKKEEEPKQEVTND